MNLTQQAFLNRTFLSSDIANPPSIRLPKPQHKRSRPGSLGLAAASASKARNQDLRFWSKTRKVDQLKRFARVKNEL
jgi:hypothetical protein